MDFKQFLDRSKLQHKQFQIDGVKWIIENELRDRHIRGGFIADEMGLGKTIMMIGTMVCNFLERTLIIVPPILIEQWASQIYKTTGHKVLIYHGANKKRFSVEDLNKAIIVISTYGEITISKKDVERKKTNSLLHKILWSRIIFDEAHHLRNGNTGRNAGAVMLSSKIRWLVSGTPIQNKKQDFYSLCDIIRIPASFYKKTENLLSLTREFILKRTKKEVGIELSSIVQHKNIVEWKHTREKEFAEKLHSLLDFVKETETESIGSPIFKSDKNSHLELLLRARQLCIYPKLLASCLFNQKFADVLTKSSKLDFVLEKILERKENGCGKLVFCHFRSEMDAITMRLKEEGIHSVAIFDGRSGIAKKSEILRKKNEVLILQIQTGCEGLNLQENYSEIYFVSPHWNPAIEDQAIARCHRFGQTKPVYVQHFEMEDFVKNENKIRTIDNYVGLVQNIKRGIINKYLL